MGGEAEGYSIPAQRQACLRKARSLGASVDEEFVDRGESAKTANRPELMRMLRHLQENPADYVIVHKVDRLARSRADDVAITLAIRESGAQLVSCSENIDETPSGLLLHGIMSSIAEFYSQNLATEVRKGMKQKARTGGTVTKSPVGYRHVRRMENGREFRTIEIDPERARFVRLAFEYYATGDWSITSLLDHLTTMGFTCRPGPHTVPKPLTRAALHKLLCNPYYTGKVSYRGTYYPGQHQPLIDRQLFDQVQAALLAHRHAGEKQQVTNHYLKGSIFCGHCGSRLGVSKPRNHQGIIYDYFYCLGRQRDKNTCSQKVLRIASVEESVEDHYRTVQIPDTRIADIRHQIRKALFQRQDEAEATKRVYSLRAQRLSEEQQKLLRLHYDDVLSPDLFKEEMQRITRELDQAQQQLAATSIHFDTIEHNVDRALELARDCHAAYSSADDATRRLFNQAFFEKLCVYEDGSVTHELAEPFKILLNPRLPELLSTAPATPPATKRQRASRHGFSHQKTHDPAFCRVVGSNIETMVGDTGLEPVTSAV